MVLGPFPERKGSRRSGPRPGISLNTADRGEKMGARKLPLGMTALSGYGVGILSVENGSGKYPIEDFAFLD